MSAIRVSPKTERESDSRGLTALGAAGGWQVDIDGSNSGLTQNWFAQIEGPAVYVSFEVQSPSVIEDMIEFLTERTADEFGIQRVRESEIVVGIDEGAPVTLLRDDEFSDRFFLLMQSKKNLAIRVTIADTDLDSLLIALRQAQNELEGA